MPATKKHRKTAGGALKKASPAKQRLHGSIFSPPDQGKYLDATRLHRLERSFRDWAAATSRADVRRSRLRILAIFLLIRYTGAKLSEVLHLDPTQDIDIERRSVRFGRRQAGTGRDPRTVQLSDTLCRELRTIVADASAASPSGVFNVDPGFVRRKFYERAEACGIAKQLGAPAILRRSRAVELMQANMPLPAVQMLLGHSTPNLTSAYVSFSEADIHRLTHHYMEKESARKTSARNSFFVKIRSLRKGDIQTHVELITIDGHRITTVITSESAERLNLKAGDLITAEVKAPWVIVQIGPEPMQSSADNAFEGVVERINRGRINSEVIVRISGGTRVCSLITAESDRGLNLAPGDRVRVLFNSFAVVLMAE